MYLQITFRIDCKLLESKSIGNNKIAEPSTPEVVLGGEVGELTRGFMQDFFFINADYLPVEGNLIDNYCRENSCGVDCRGSTAILEAELDSITESNDGLSRDVADCEVLPTLGPTMAPGCVPVDETNNGDGTCTKCVCSDEQQETCFNFNCS